jgi:hypothetical protein
MDIAAKHSLPVLGQLPIDSRVAEACDNGTVEDLEEIYLTDAVGMIERL